ncbi:hypothetical protein SDC9_103111 [bioreactor metagenome]|uniref:Uncharacterized protein n=1 Tax=bioreactor metagenome TaxID=1076179 RepID=A0A645ATA6_9ZZZZ
MPQQTQAAALKEVTSIITRCERMQPKFAPGTAQHTLLKNRIQALQIARGLLAETGTGGYSAQELSAALEPLASILRKCAKAQAKYVPGSVQHRRFNGTMAAMELCRTCIENELQRRPV